MGFMSGSPMQPAPMAYHHPHHHMGHFAAIATELEPLQPKHHRPPFRQQQQQQKSPEQQQQERQQQQLHGGVDEDGRGRSEDSADHRIYKRFRSL
mmetsp:Transcript_26059/g.55836  ORF Transcript_26059/g.55836 Transcript_26059/m.55836 type:complete len:95 (-) Transcript_26059:464-748(-)